MASDLSLLFQLRADNAQAKAVMADTRQAVTQLRSQFGKDLTSIQGVAKTALADIGENVNAFVGQRIPLIGGAFLRVTSNLKGFNDELKKGGPQTKALAEQIDGIAKASGKSSTEVSRFLTSFVRLEGQAARNNAAFKFFGGSVDLIGNKTAKFLPELEQAGTSLAGVATQAEGTGAAVASMAGPIGIAVIALAAMAIGAAAAAKQLFELTKQAADFQGRMFDLAQQTGLQVETLSALEVVAKTTGGELGSITQAIVNFQRKLDDAQDPLSKTAEQFRKFQISTTDTETALRQTFAALAAMPPGFAQTNAAAEFFGARGGKQVLAILKETNGDLDATIKRLRDLGILISDDAARAADKFNDELELLNFQIRALGAAAAEDLIPAMTEIIKGLGQLLTALRPVVALLGTFAGPVVRTAGEGLQNLSTLVRLVTRDYKALAEAIIEAKRARDISPIDVPDVTPVPLPGAPTPQQTTSEAVNRADAVLSEIRRRVASHNQQLDALFQQGRLNREQRAEETIRDNQRVLKAEQDRIDAVLAKKEQELRALEQAQRDRGEIVNRDTDAYRAVTAEIVKLQQERLDKENEFTVSSRVSRAKAAKEEADSRRADAQHGTEILVGELDRRIAATQAAITQGTELELDGLRVIEELEQAKVEVRRRSLETQQKIGFLSLDEQKAFNRQLQQLGQEADRLRDEQDQRRLSRRIALAEEEARRLSAIALSAAEAIIAAGQVGDQARIARIQTFAALRVKTEEQAEQEILRVKLDAIDRDDELARLRREAAETEIEARLKVVQDQRGTLQSQLEKTPGIEDESQRAAERVRLIGELQRNVDAELALQTKATKDGEALDQDLTNQLRVNNAQRKALTEQGAREIDEARQRDLENERRYADELAEIQERIRDIQRDAARDVIRLMELHFARRRDIIRAQRDLDLAEEADRHRRETESIKQQEREVNDRITVLESYLKSLKIGTDAEIEQYERITAELEKLRLKREELKRQQQAEDERTKTRKRRVTTEADDDEKDADPIGRIEIDLDSIKEIARALEDTIVPLGEILQDTFLRVADAIGQTVANWVLLGETGPAVMRKILAQALASIAAEAAVNAIKELALGFATLFFNPAESAAHFTAAAIWGSIGGVAAVAGRAVAGDLFKQKPTDNRGGNNGSSGSPNPLQTIAQNRNQPQTITIILRPDESAFGKLVRATVVEDIGNGGVIREVINSDGR